MAARRKPRLVRSAWAKPDKALAACVGGDVRTVEELACDLGVAVEERLNELRGARVSPLVGKALALLEAAGSADEVDPAALEDLVRSHVTAARKPRTTALASLVLGVVSGDATRALFKPGPALAKCIGPEPDSLESLALDLQSDLGEFQWNNAAPVGNSPLLRRLKALVAEAGDPFDVPMEALVEVVRENSKPTRGTGAERRGRVLR